MRNELQEIQLIEHYLQGKLSEKHLKLVEEKIATDSEFASSVEKQKQVLEGVEHLALKQNVSRAKSKFSKLKLLKKVGVVLVGTAIIGAGIFAISKMNSKIDTSLLNQEKNLKYALNEVGDSIWADADKSVPSSFYQIDNSKDTVIVTENGMVIAIPSGAFLNENGNTVNDIELEMKEALNPEDIISSGLSTYSGSQLLETGGMFYLNARKDGKNLKVNPEKEIVADVPSSDKLKPRMQLYDGERKADGSIDWVNPKPIEQFLTNVDIKTLDFYPDSYLPKLAELGHVDKDKVWTDSLYYSFGGNEVRTKKEPRKKYTSWESIHAGDTTKGEYWDVEPAVEEAYDSIYLTVDELETNDQINPSKIQSIWQEKFNGTLLATKEFEERLKYIHQTCNDEILDLYVNNTDKRLAYIDSLVVEKLCGEWSFENPNLSVVKIGEVPRRTITVQENEYLYGDGRAIDFLMSEQEAQRLSKSPICPNDLKGFRRDTIQESKRISHVPSPYFLLTQDAAVDILETVDVAVEEAKKEIDSKDLCTIFQNFARQNKGRVKPGSKSAKMLSSFYQKRSNEYSQMAQKAIEKTKKKYANVIKDLGKETTKNVQQNTKNKASNFSEELEINMDEAYRQLERDRKKEARIRENNSYRVEIRSTGWKNIDQAVVESLVSRTTLDFTDKNGKTAKIEYKKFSVEVEDGNSYDKVFVYLLPNKISSYMRVIKNSGNIFTENLNELMHYSCVVYAQKGEDEYVWAEHNAYPEDYKANLVKTDKKKFKNLMNRMVSSSPAKSLFEEIKSQKKIQNFSLEKIRFENDFQFREEVKTGIWYCYEGAGDEPIYSIAPKDGSLGL